ncbi:hypothetical protein DFH07DRAFT_842256 [Mycena maculata]|uniref:Uncharacterized protein n=1 Tax=Mycena maculata TaxID=230809 RepID=A0AAD7I862_9AGAR|nr:hypothetical protein DFH07DRAFT_842256 [Mycena maculata]
MQAVARPKCGNVSASMNLYIDTRYFPNCLNHSQQPTIQQNSEEYLWGNVVTTYTSSGAAKMQGINGERLVHELIEEVSRAGNEVEGKDRTRVSGRMVPAALPYEATRENVREWTLMGRERGWHEAEEVGERKRAVLDFGVTRSKRTMFCAHNDGPTCTGRHRQSFTVTTCG